MINSLIHGLRAVFAMILFFSGVLVLNGQDKTAQVAGKDLILVENGASLAPIILPKDPTMFTKIAAKDLAEYIGKIGGAKPEIIEGTPDPVPEHAIWVGFQEKFKELFPGTDFDFKNPEEILIKCDGKNLAIVGRDVWDPISNKMTIKGGKSEKESKSSMIGFQYSNRDVVGFQFEYGTVNAVYTFLQDNLGVRWLWPGQDGEVVPKQKVIVFKPFEFRYHPKLRNRSGVFHFISIYKQGELLVTAEEIGFADSVHSSIRCMCLLDMPLPTGQKDFPKPIRNILHCSRMAQELVKTTF
ncbi:MAG TPA: hypothetical protein PK821_05805 [Victivallales bacterium]|nr:hypothetical protein [Victivallales bacterium]